MTLYVGGTVLVLGIVVLLPRTAYRVLHRFLPVAAIRKRLLFLKDLPSRRSAQWLALAAARYVVYASQMVLLLYAFAPGLSLRIALLGTMLVTLSAFIIPPITAMELGIREGAAVFFLGLLGVSQADAFNASLLLSAIDFLLPALIGLPFVLRLRRHTTAPVSS